MYKILLVDDERWVRTALRKTIEKNMKKCLGQWQKKAIQHLEQSPDEINYLELSPI
jgi:CheY-like chemotaxis protein